MASPASALSDCPNGCPTAPRRPAISSTHAGSCSVRVCLEDRCASTPYRGFESLSLLAPGPLRGVQAVDAMRSGGARLGRLPHFEAADQGSRCVRRGTSDPMVELERRQSVGSSCHERAPARARGHLGGLQGAAVRGFVSALSVCCVRANQAAPTMKRPPATKRLSRRPKMWCAGSVRRSSSPIRAKE